MNHFMNYSHFLSYKQVYDFDNYDFGYFFQSAVAAVSRAPRPRSSFLPYRTYRIT